ncbi:MAG TPA: hypothetical protein VMG99_08980 [Thermoplasmata archaeon]|nr:hypothetical protein [Thermoplasmata archaeon]
MSGYPATDSATAFERRAKELEEIYGPRPRDAEGRPLAFTWSTGDELLAELDRLRAIGVRYWAEHGGRDPRDPIWQHVPPPPLDKEKAVREWQEFVAAERSAGRRALK